MYFLSLFCQISKEIEAVLRGKLVIYTHINFTNRTAKKLSPVITDSRLWLNNLLPKSAFPAAGEGLQHPPAPPAQPSCLCQCQRGGGRSNVATTDVITAVPLFCRASCAHIPSATALGQSSYLTCTALSPNEWNAALQDVWTFLSGCLRSQFDSHMVKDCPVLCQATDEHSLHTFGEHFGNKVTEEIFKKDLRDG